MKQKLTLLFLCFAMVLTLCTFFTFGASAVGEIDTTVPDTADDWDGSFNSKGQWNGKTEDFTTFEGQKGDGQSAETAWQISTAEQLAYLGTLMKSDASFADDQDLVRMADRGKPVCNGENGTVFHTGYMYRYNPAVLRCLEHIKNGDLGEIYSINAEMSTFHGAPYKKWLKSFGGGIMYILGSHLVDLIVYMMGEPKKITSFLKHTGLDGVDFEDNNLAVLEYDKALARIFVSSVEVNGFGRRQLVVSGSKGTVNICPLERPITMTYSDTSIADKTYEDRKIVIPFEDHTADGRYDEMMQDLYAYIMGTKQNPFTYEHDYLVQKVLSEIVGGVRFNGKNID